MAKLVACDVYNGDVDMLSHRDGSVHVRFTAIRNELGM